MILLTINHLFEHNKIVTILLFNTYYVMFWPFDPAKNAIQGDAPEGSDTF